MFSLSEIDNADEMKLDSTESLGRYLEFSGFVVLSNSGRQVTGYYRIATRLTRWWNPLLPFMDEERFSGGNSCHWSQDTGCNRLGVPIIQRGIVQESHRIG